MAYRIFIKRTLQHSFIVCILMMISIAGWSVVAAAKPNILLFMPDQHRYDYTSLNTESVVFYKLTPNLLKLADAGVSFNQAFCPSPL